MKVAVNGNRPNGLHSSILKCGNSWARFPAWGEKPSGGGRGGNRIAVSRITVCVEQMGQFKVLVPGLPGSGERNSHRPKWGYVEVRGLRPTHAAPLLIVLWASFSHVPAGGTAPMVCIQRGPIFQLRAVKSAASRGLALDPLPETGKGLGDPPALVRS